LACPRIEERQYPKLTEDEDAEGNDNKDSDDWSEVEATTDESGWQGCIAGRSCPKGIRVLVLG
jgi:hypothetical protein